MYKIAFLIGFLPNPRIYKRISFAQRDNEVFLICWDRGKQMMENPEGRGTPCRVIQIDAGNDPLSRVIPSMQFAKKATITLDKVDPDIIHVQGLDMLHIACKYKAKHSKVHIIYEVADLHRLLVDKQKGIIKKIAQCYLLSQDRKCSKKADLLIVTSQQYYDTYFTSFVPRDKVLYFPNVPDLSAFDSYEKKKDHAPLTIGYFGVIRYKNELKLLINSLEKHGAKLVIAGYEEHGNDIEELSKNRADIVWIGRYDFKESASKLYSMCDCIYAVYDADMANCQVALPNKLYEAVFCEMPILVADNTYVGEVVREWGVGIPVLHDSQESVDAAISELQKDNVYQFFENQCTKHKDEIDLEKYNILLQAKVTSFMKN